MKTDRREIGKRAEDIAAAFLTKKGMKILARNLRLGRGELDCVAMDGKVLVFVEVKAATGSDDHHPELQVGPAKQKQLVRLALAYAGRHRLDDCEMRFDVVAVSFGRGDEPDVKHFQNAFDVAGRFHRLDN